MSWTDRAQLEQSGMSRMDIEDERRRLLALTIELRRGLHELAIEVERREERSGAGFAYAHPLGSVLRTVRQISRVLRRAFPSDLH